MITVTPFGAHFLERGKARTIELMQVQASARGGITQFREHAENPLQSRARQREHAPARATHQHRLAFAAFLQCTANLRQQGQQIDTLAANFYAQFDVIPTVTRLIDPRGPLARLLHFEREARIAPDDPVLGNERGDAQHEPGPLLFAGKRPRIAQSGWPDDMRADFAQSQQ